MKIYTRRGDAGSTSLLGGVEVSKTHLRVHAYGEVDELNAVLGWVRAADLPDGLDDLLARVQATCFRLGAYLAAAPGKDPGVEKIGPADTSALEEAIDRIEEALEPLKTFILPAGGEAAARLHVARGVARRTERTVVALEHAEDVDAEALRWLNRLSDLLFVAARAANRHEGTEDVPWLGTRGG